MADISALERALVNADAAGDTAGAQVLASEITRLRSEPAQAQPGVIEDVAKSGLSGLAQGGINTFGAGGDVRSLVGRGIDAAGGALGFAPDKVQQFKDMAKTVAGATLAGRSLLAAPTSSDLRKGVESVTGELYKPQTTAGEYARTVGEFAPGVLGGPGSIGARALTNVVAPAVLSETAGQLTQGTSAEPWARLAGAVAAPVGLSGARRALTPNVTSPERQAAAAVLQGEGVPLTAGQQTGSRTLRYAESELGGSKAADFIERQNQAFTEAAMKRAGGSGLATSDNLKTLNDRLGSDFSNISSRNTLVPDRQFGQDVGATLNRYGKLLEAQQKPIINNVSDDLIARLQANNGVLPGAEYQAIRSDLSLAAKSTTNPALSGAFKGLRNALDKAMERSIAVNNPSDLGKWGELRRQYGNMKVLERAAVGAGEDAGMGIISPARLRTAAAVGNRGGFARGDSDFSELAKAGQAMMTPLPQSGTAPRLRVQNLFTTIPAVLGAAAGAPGGVFGSMLGAAAGAAAPAAAGRALMSKPIQAYLTNQKFAGKVPASVADLWPLLVSSSAAREAVLPPFAPTNR